MTVVLMSWFPTVEFSEEVLNFAWKHFETFKIVFCYTLYFISQFCLKCSGYIYHKTIHIYVNVMSSIHLFACLKNLRMNRHFQYDVCLIEHFQHVLFVYKRMRWGHFKCKKKCGRVDIMDGLVMDGRGQLTLSNLWVHNNHDDKCNYANLK